MNTQILMIGAAILTFGTSQMATADRFTQNKDGGLQIDSTSRTKALKVVGAVDDDTAIYTDTQGLYPDVNIDVVQEENQLMAKTTVITDTVAAEPVDDAQVNVPDTPEKTSQDEEFDLIDANDDQLISEEEFFLEVLEPEHQELFASYDGDKNGYLDKTEFEGYYLHFEGVDPTAPVH